MVQTTIKIHNTEELHTEGQQVTKVVNTVPTSIPGDMLTT